MPNYIDVKELRKELTICKETNNVTIRFYEMLELMVKELNRKYPITCQHELVQDVVLIIFRSVNTIQLEKNVFNWLTTVILNRRNMLFRQDCRRNTLLNSFKEHTSKKQNNGQFRNGRPLF